jgi:hypothetical protein
MMRRMAVCAQQHTLLGLGDQSLPCKRQRITPNVELFIVAYMMKMERRNVLAVPTSGAGSAETLDQPNLVPLAIHCNIVFAFTF